MVLAAGRSTRMGGANKLLEDVGGRPLVARAVDALLASHADPVVVVTGHQAAEVEGALGGRPLRVVRNSRPEAGMGASLARGVAALDRLRPPPDGALVALGDMPDVSAAGLEALLAAFQEAGPEAIVVPVHGGRRGHPVLFGAAHLPALRRLAGDRGARAVLEANAGRVVEVPVDDPGVLRDVDTPAQLERARRAARPEAG